MSLVKKLAKLALLALIVAVVGGIAMAVKSSRAQREVTLDEWPDVPRNPAA